MKVIIAITKLIAMFPNYMGEHIVPFMAPTIASSKVKVAGFTIYI
jgi:hypothetical protein